MDQLRFEAGIRLSFHSTTQLCSTAAYGNSIGEGLQIMQLEAGVGV
jgi:hypothetical protein